MDFKESSWMYLLAIGVVVFILVQSLFFIVKSWKQGKKIGISAETMKNTIVSSFLFTLAPALSILTTVIALSAALGIVLPWIRLTVIGNLAYETVAAENALSALGSTLNSEVTDHIQFSTVSWAMTIGACSPLLVLPLVCKKIQKKLGDTINKSEKNSAIADIGAAAAFIGIISAFIARAIAGTSTDGSTNAGVMSVTVLIVSIVAMLVLSKLCTKFHLTKLEPFAMPVSMFIGMGSAILMNVFLPDVAAIVWR